jgi:predicted component of type VI protein secretion system
MSLTRLLFKPKWQDKNADVRRAAVATDRDADLIAALPQIARGDADANVRAAALKRLDDYETWRERSTGDTDPAVRRIARDAYLNLLCSNAARVPALARRIAELDTLSAEEIEKVAAQAADRDLRVAALAQTTRPALLAERAVRDPDAAIRLAVLERIGDTAALERVAERARKTDKAVSRRARELIEAQRIGSGDAAALAQNARTLCERLEALVRSPADDDTVHDAIVGEWNALGDAVPADLTARFRGAEALVRQTRINVHNLPREAASAPSAEALHLDRLASQSRFEAALANAAAEAQRERELRRAHLHEMEQILPAYTAALEAGAVSAAHAPHDRLLNLTAMVVPLPAALETKLAPLHAHYAELKQQQIWANRRRREMLCDDVGKLAQSGLHPDALALRVREVREEWQRLDAAEGLAGNAESSLARRFHATCHRALKPAKAYFDKRAEVRKSHAGEIEKLLQDAAALPEEIVDWKSAGQLRLKLGEAMRSLDGVDPRTRTELARQIKAAIAQLAPRIDAHADTVEAAKRRLVVRATALLQQSDGRAVAREARELQQQWSVLGNGRRGNDQRQWKEFRGALDAAFGQLDAARKQRDEEAAATRAQAESLLAEIQALHATTDGEEHETRAKLRDIDARWPSLTSADRTLEQRYHKLHEAIEAGLRGAARRKRVARYTQALEKYALLRALETGAQTGEAIAPAWTELPASTDFAAALDARFTLAASSPVMAESNEDAARNLLVDLEFFAGLETPAEDRQRRMNFQVQRLASRMRDRGVATPETELTRLLQAWFAQTAQQPELEDRFLRAATAAIETLP